MTEPPEYYPEPPAPTDAEIASEIGAEYIKNHQRIYPEGRLYFYEGDDVVAFVGALLALGLEPRVSVHVPPEQAALGLRLAWAYPVGT